MEPNWFWPAIFVLVCIAGIIGSIRTIRRKERIVHTWSLSGLQKRVYTGNSAIILGYIQLLVASFTLSGVVAVYVVRDSPIVWILFGAAALTLLIGIFAGTIIRYSTPPTNE